MKQTLTVLLKRYWAEIIISSILAAGIFLRFYNFLGRFSLGDETVRDALIGFEGARTLQLPLTGPFSSAGPFFFGPWYWYHMIFSVFVFHSLYAPWIFLAAASVCFIFLMYKLGEKIHGKTFGLIIAYLVAISPPQIIGALHLTNPNLVPIYAGLVIYLYFKILSSSASPWWSLLFGTVLGIAINNHYSALYLSVLGVFSLFEVRKPMIHGMVAFAGLVATMVPLLIFNLINHWFLLRNLWYYALHGKELIYVANSWTIYALKFWPRLWADILGVPVGLGIVLIATIVIAILYDILKNKNNHMMRLALSFFIVFVALRYYWGERFYGYFNFLHPFIFIFSALPIYLLAQHKVGKWLAIVCLIGLTVLSMPVAKIQMQTRDFNTEMFMLEKRIRESVPDSTISWYVCRQIIQSRDYSLVFLLNADGQQKGKSRKIGFSHGSCGNPAYEAILNPDGLTYAPFVEPNTGLRLLDLVDLSEASTAALTSASWSEFSPKTIYDSNTRWWMSEQP